MKNKKKKDSGPQNPSPSHELSPQHGTVKPCSTQMGTLCG